MENVIELFRMCKNENFDLTRAKELIKKIEPNKVYNLIRESEFYSPFEDKTTLLYEAYWNWNIKMVKLLLDNGADPNFYEENDGPIISDLRFNWFEKDEKECFELLKLLLDYGADPNKVWDGESAIENALDSFNDDFAELEWYRYNEKYYVYLLMHGGRVRGWTQEWYEKVFSAEAENYKKYFTEDGFLK